MTSQRPTLLQETALWQAGYRFIAGVDEVGRGALAGPVVAAAVIVPAQTQLTGVWDQVRDSKLLTSAVRTRLARAIQAEAVASGVGMIAPSVIDAIGIAAAVRLAMEHAIDALAPKPDFLLIDWMKLPMISIPQISPSKADRDMVAVAAASILAKVQRDAFMSALHVGHPHYAFAHNKGYGTAAHLTALNMCGPCPAHRFSFAPVARSTTASSGRRNLVSQTLPSHGLDDGS